MEATRTKEHLSVVFLGHAKAGKSTAIGHLLYKLGEVDRKVIDRLEREARDAGKTNAKFAWVSAGGRAADAATGAAAAWGISSPSMHWRAPGRCCHHSARGAATRS